MTPASNSSTVPPTAPSVRAAQYLRMSTEHQQYSLRNQEDAIRAYAQENGLEIVKTYSDAAKSGVTLTQRSSLPARMPICSQCAVRTRRHQGCRWLSRSCPTQVALRRMWPNKVPDFTLGVSGWYRAGLKQNH